MVNLTRNPQSNNKMFSWKVALFLFDNYSLANSPKLFPPTSTVQHLAPYTHKESMTESGAQGTILASYEQRKKILGWGRQSSPKPAPKLFLPVPSSFGHSSSITFYHLTTKTTTIVVNKGLKGNFK